MARRRSYRERVFVRGYGESDGVAGWREESRLQGDHSYRADIPIEARPDIRVEAENDGRSEDREGIRLRGEHRRSDDVPDGRVFTRWNTGNDGEAAGRDDTKESFLFVGGRFREGSNDRGKIVREEDANRREGPEIEDASNAREEIPSEEHLQCGQDVIEMAPEFS